jgi:hypothetical protein
LPAWPLSSFSCAPWNQVAGHQDIINVTPAEEELRSQHSLDEEATRLIQAASPDIAAKDPQRQLAGTPAAGVTSSAHVAASIFLRTA